MSPVSFLGPGLYYSMEAIAVRMTHLLRALLLTAVLLSCGAAVVYAAGTPADAVPFTWDSLLSLRWPGAFLGACWSPLGRAIADWIRTFTSPKVTSRTTQEAEAFTQLAGILRDLTTAVGQIQENQDRTVQTLVYLSTQVAILMDRTPRS